MEKYRFLVTVVAETHDQAVEVMAERILYDEDYGFPYEVDWEDDAEALDKIKIKTD
jgi:hypothetical protein